MSGKDGGPDQRTLVWVRREGGTRYGGQDYYAVRRGPWKLLQNTSVEPFKFFNIENDPQETTPLGKPVKERRELESLLREHVRRAGFIPWQGRVPDQEIVKRNTLCELRDVLLASGAL